MNTSLSVGSPIAKDTNIAQYALVTSETVDPDSALATGGDISPSKAENQRKMPEALNNGGIPAVEEPFLEERKYTQCAWRKFRIYHTHFIT